MRTSGIVFDCDGTLLDSMDVWRECESSLALRAGATLTDANRDALCTMTIPEVGVFFHEALGLGSSAQDVLRMIDDFMMEYYSQRSVAREGALAFVQALSEAGVRMSVASSSPQPYLQAGLAHTGIAPCLDAIVSVDDVGVSKREPVVYEHARLIMGTPLERTWGMEDSLYAIQTLKRGGFRTVGIYDCDVNGTFAGLKAESELAVRGFAELDPTYFVG